jgi:hypothetical protein
MDTKCNECTVTHGTTLHIIGLLSLVLILNLVSPVKVSDAKDRLLSLNQKSAEGTGEYGAEIQRLLIFAYISNETDYVYTFLRGLRRFTALYLYV